MQGAVLPAPVHASALVQQGEQCTLGSVTVGTLASAVPQYDLLQSAPERMLHFLGRPQRAGKEVPFPHLPGCVTPHV